MQPHCRDWGCFYTVRVGDASTPLVLLLISISDIYFCSHIVFVMQLNYGYDVVEYVRCYFPLNMKNCGDYASLSVWHVPQFSNHDHKLNNKTQPGQLFNFWHHMYQTCWTNCRRYDPPADEFCVNLRPYFIWSPDGSYPRQWILVRT